MTKKRFDRQRLNRHDRLNVLSMCLARCTRHLAVTIKRDYFSWRFHHRRSNYTIRRRRFLRPPRAIEKSKACVAPMTKQPFRRIDRIVAATNWTGERGVEAQVSDNTRGNEFSSLLGSSVSTWSSVNDAGAFPGDGFERLVKHVEICTTWRTVTNRSSLRSIAIISFGITSSVSRFDHRFLRFSEKESFGRDFLNSLPSEELGNWNWNRGEIRVKRVQIDRILDRMAFRKFCKCFDVNKNTEMYHFDTGMTRECMTASQIYFDRKVTIEV